MKRILFEFPGHTDNRLFDPDARDNTLQPFIYLRDTLRDRGYELMTADNHPVKDAEWIWFWDVPAIARPTNRFRRFARSVRSRLHQKTESRRNLYEEGIRAGLGDRLVLFLGEPPVVLARNWDVEFHKLFPIIFTWNDNLIDGTKYHKYNYPQPLSFPFLSYIPFADKRLLVNISGNKFSEHPHELYSSRRKTIQYFEENYPDQFDLYGTGWNQVENDPVTFHSYRGAVRHKWDVYPHYKFGLCYENALDEPGFITEKIFDCMRSGCVPIYWGAPNITDFVDAETFIERTNFRSDADLAEFLICMGEEEYLHYQQAIKVYLNSLKFESFLPPAFADTIIRVLSL